MTIGYGILLFFFGSSLTIIGLYIAYDIGSRPSKKEEKTSLLPPFLN
tara:strand:+ start:472 stop:612 length:141 start_codon:yes stop_codon:yes gene_type:complete